MKTSALACLALGAYACGHGAPAAEATKPPFSGGFTDITPAVLPGTLPAADPTKPETWTVGLFADLDGDGNHDLVLSADNLTLAYRWDGASGSWIAGKNPLSWSPATVQGIEDFDHDGFPDFWLSDGSVEWGTGSGPHPYVGMTDGANWTRGTGFSYADVDSDGWLDIVGAGVCCDKASCRDLAVELRTGPRDFRLLGDDSGLPPGPRTKSYLAGFAELDGVRTLVQLGEKCAGVDAAPSSFFRETGLDGAGFPQYAAFDPLPPDASFREGSPTRPVSDLAPMGAAVGDLDGDGRLDLVVATNPYLEIFQQQEDGSLRTRGAASGILRRPGEKNFQLPWGVAVVDVDLDGRNDLVVAYGNDGDARSKPAAYIGPQDVALYLNRGDFRFEDATRWLGARKGQWKTLVVDDFDCDGDPDFAVGGDDEWPQVLRNDVGDHRHALSLRLHGSLGNELGIGAQVEVWPEGGGEVRRALVGGILSPQAFSPPAAYVGLGEATAAERVRVTFPSGVVRELSNVQGGRCVEVDEPVVVALTPSTRRTRVGASFRLVITPRDEGGFGRDAKVEVRVASGPAKVEVSGSGFGTEATVTSAEAGSSVIEIRLDGVPLRVRPRLWWDP